MEKEEKVKEEKSTTTPVVKPEDERTQSNSDQGLDRETIQILLDDRVSTGG